MQERNYYNRASKPVKRSAKRGRRSRSYKPSLWILWFPVCTLYCEILLRAFTEADVFFGFIAMLGFSCSFGFVLDIFCFMLKSEKTKSTLRWIVTILIPLCFTVEYFLFNSYRVFMDLKSIITGAGGVMGEFGGVVVSAVISGLPKIFIFFMPVIILALLTMLRVSFNVERYPKNEFNKSGALALAAAALASFALGFVGILSSTPLSDCYFGHQGFDATVRSLGLVTAARLDVETSLTSLLGGGENGGSGFVIDDVPIIDDDVENDGGEAADGAVTDGEATDNGTEDAPAPKVYGKNKLNYDFDKLIAEAPNSEVSDLHYYVATLKPSMQNDYTGLFEGKNLIFITAEAFSAEVIDPELTPTLYRLANNGFKFTDYYQPAWGGSTSSGEYSLLSGLVPTSGVKSMKGTIGKNLSFTIANKLKAEGYFTAAYHNGEYDYYSRNQTHTNFGYDTFTGMGNGMENGVKKVWPESDLEMMQYTLPLYSGEEPFCIYYMTVSGHCLYTRGGNNMTKKNWDAVQHLDCSDTVKGYYAANLELEYAMQYTLEYLEQNGLLEDTVIVISTDHYPYGLEKSESWGNTEDYLSELYGFDASGNVARDHSALIIWSGSLETDQKDMVIQIDDPVYSLDVLPTLCNLFGVPYDSRTLVGRDVFSDTDPLVIWMDTSWKTNLGYYSASNGRFTPAVDIFGNEVEIPDGYVDSIKNIVKNKISFSRTVIKTDYYQILEGGLTS